MPVPVDAYILIHEVRDACVCVPGIDVVYFCSNQNLVNESCFSPLAAGKYSSSPQEQKQRTFSAFTATVYFHE